MKNDSMNTLAPDPKNNNFIYLQKEADELQSKYRVTMIKVIFLRRELFDKCEKALSLPTPIRPEDVCENMPVLLQLAEDIAWLNNEIKNTQCAIEKIENDLNDLHDLDLRLDVLR